MSRIPAAIILLASLTACSGKDDNAIVVPTDTGGEPDMSTNNVVEDMDEPVDLAPDVPAEPGSLAIDPESITFSDVRQGETATAPLALSNLGGSPIVVTGVQLIEMNRTGEPEFLEGDDWSSSFVLEPDTFRELVVVYEPKDFGIDQGRLEFFTNDPDNSMVQVRIETVSAYAQLEGPGFLRFGEVNMDDSSTKRLTFYNRGLDSLTIDSVDLIGITGTFEIAFEATATPPTVLERDEDFVIDVTYTPDDMETHRGTIALNSDAPDQQTFEVALVGNDPTPCMDITPDIADLGEIGPGTSGTQQVTLLNCSQTLQLEVSEINLTDDGDGAFAVSGLPDVPITLPPLQTAQFTVSGTLAEPGIATGEVAVSSSDPTTSGLVPLRVTAIEP